MDALRTTFEVLAWVLGCAVALTLLVGLIAGLRGGMKEAAEMRREEIREIARREVLAELDRREAEKRDST